MDEAAFSPEAVRSHYRRLAPAYALRANRACQRAYRELVTKRFSDADSVLELGAGGAQILATLPARRKIAVDSTVQMLGRHAGVLSLVGDASALPLEDGTVDAVFCINLLEHVSDCSLAAAEIHRVLRPGGRFLVITPNGEVSRVLEALELLRLKLPEGPHRFLKRSDLAELVRGLFTILEHKGMLSLPYGNPSMARTLDKLLPWSLFQYICCKK